MSFAAAPRYIPLAYTTPKFPSLYWPINAKPGEAQYLYYLGDTWRFTVYWTLITYGAAHLLVSLSATLMQLRSAFVRRRRMQEDSWKRLSPQNKKLLGENPVGETLTWVWLIPLVYLVIGGVEALLAGSLLGLIVGTVYTAGDYRMSTWMPFIWGLINVLVLILSSFRIQGGL